MCVPIHSVMGVSVLLLVINIGCRHVLTRFQDVKSSTPSSLPFHSQSNFDDCFGLSICCMARAVKILCQVVPSARFEAIESNSHTSQWIMPTSISGFPTMYSKEEWRRCMLDFNWLGIIWISRHLDVRLMLMLLQFYMLFLPKVGIVDLYSLGLRTLSLV